MSLLEAGSVEEECVLDFRGIPMDGNIADNTEKEFKIVKKIGVEGFIVSLLKADATCSGIL